MDSLLPYLDTTMAILFALFLIFFYNNLLRKTPTPKANPPPQPGSAWPLIGHLPLLTGSNLPHVALATLADKSGPVLTIRIGSQPVLVLSHSEMAKELFTVNDLAVTSRPALVAAKFMGYNYAFFPFTPAGGPCWRETRKLSTLGLLSNRRLELLKHIRIQEVEASIKELHRSLTSTNKKTADMKQWFSDLNHNVLLRMVIGKKYFGEGGSSGEKEGRQFQKAISVLFHYLGTLVLRDAAPFLGWMDLGGHEKNMKKTAKVLDDILDKWLEEHKRKRYLSEEDKGE
ncbi:hypothetical protein JCGZ_09178 [Jatropha curcas]|uniref:Cytochrome P450 n=1 Tax=Jatropha curcas TaxID=180498 RepID=A0A067KRH4_JATCU|nr:hypothetical protein JCGZ_09178 [Jatropha curcas]